MSLDYNEEGSVIYSDKTPEVSTNYFCGSWTSITRTGALIDYNSTLETPLQILDKSERRDRLVEGLREVMPKTSHRQLVFFEDLEHDSCAEMNKTLDQLVARRDNGSKLYHQWKQEVKGKERDLVMVSHPLDIFLRRYVKPIIMQAPCHESCHGGERGWSPERSLRSHLPLGSVFTFDLRNVFEHVEIQHVFDFFYDLFDGKIKGDTRRDVAGFLSTLCTAHVNGKYNATLPQGSPVGIALFNRMMYSADELMSDKARNRGFRYSRWGDDFILSSPETDIPVERFTGAIRVVNGNFPIAPEKVFWQQNEESYYLLGHKITGNVIFGANGEEKKSRGSPVRIDLSTGKRLPPRKNYEIYGDDNETNPTDDFEDLKSVFRDVAMGTNESNAWVL